MKIIAVLLIITAANLFAQNSSLYIPINVKQAYDSGTRSYDGAPGENYWINKAAYKMNVKLDPEKKHIYATAEIKYYNESPDSLDEIVFKLYQQLFKKGNPRDFGLTPTDIHDGTNLNVIKHGNDTLLLGSKRIKRSSTTLSILLPDKMAPGSEETFYFDWDVKLPETATVRMGAYSDTSFFVAYWYPQIAVYDDIDGWDRNKYTGYTETYNDFNDYDVIIEVPSEFSVFATGLAQNYTDIYSDKTLKKIDSASKSDSVVSIISAEDLKNGNVFKSNSALKYHYAAEHSPDFAFAAGKNYLWDASTVMVDSISGRTAFVQAAYDQKSEDFYSVADIAAKTIRFFSFELPAVPYPYPSMTIFNGSGGMEFPMIVNDGSTKSYKSAVGLTSHEIAHTYFPFFMGTNERKHAWMDEGWARMLPTDFQEREGKYDPDDSNAKAISKLMGRDYDVPPIVLSYNLRRASYRLASYRRAHAAYEILRRTLGHEVFNKALKTYIEKWNGKHPAPLDFFFTFDEVAGEDLSWYWKPWFYEFGYADLELASLNKKGSFYEIVVNKIGNLPVTVELLIEYEDGTTEESKEPASVWKGGVTNFIIEHTTDKEIRTVKLNDNAIPDVNFENNIIEKGN
ncbi:MAG: peptidase [Melioribacteraceae bacterium]|nr:MAG: peptidase [Melioribacteraceae bacterium]